MARIAILGCGFGTALAVTADACGHQVTLWSLFPQELEEIRRDKEQRRLLPGVRVPDRIVLTSDISCLASCDLCIMAVPSFAVRQTAQRAAPYLREDTVVVNVAKGLEDGSYKRLSAGAGRRIARTESRGHVRPFPCGGGRPGRADDDYRCIQRAGGGRRSSGSFDEPSSAAVCQ